MSSWSTYKPQAPAIRVKIPTIDGLEALRERRRALRGQQIEAARNGDEIAASKVRCEASMAQFIREAWHILEPATPYLHNWSTDLMCDHLEAITRGVGIFSTRPRALFNVPPGAMKSLTISVMWQAWEWGPANLPHLRYLSTSHNDDYVKRDTRKTRDLVSSDWYQARWGDRVQLIRSGETSFANSATGSREGVAFGSLTGGRGDRVLIDDPHSVKTAESDAEREAKVRLFRESVPSRVNDPVRSAIVVIMQRIHAGDIAGEAIRQGYTQIMLPMRFEPDRRCVTPFGRDPRTKTGELLWSERFPKAVLDKDEAVMGSYTVAGQHQQRPAPREGGMFKRGSFGIVRAAPATKVKKVRGWDLAASTPKKGNVSLGSGPAFTAGVLMSYADGKIYIEHVARDRLSSAQVRRLIANTADQDRAAAPHGVIVGVPQDPGQAGKAQKDSFANDLHGHDFRITPESGDKITRADPLAAQAEAGNVFLVEGEWNEAFLAEVALFPGGTFKDQVDAASRAYMELLKLIRVGSNDEIGGPVSTGR